MESINCNFEIIKNHCNDFDKIYRKYKFSDKK